jgi:hypothetical protein
MSNLLYEFVVEVYHSHLPIVTSVTIALGVDTGDVIHKNYRVLNMLINNYGEM